MTSSSSLTIVILLCVLGVLGACNLAQDTETVKPETSQQHQVNNIDMLTIKGAAQKGPFVKGSRILVNRLSESGENTYETAISKIEDDLGNFTFPTKSQGAIEIEADGISLNEITGKLTHERTQLRAIYHVKAAATQNAYINVLTHLAHKRILKLLRQGVAIDAAIQQGEAAVIESFSAIMPISKIGAFSELSLFQTQNKNEISDAYLLALSAIIYQCATNFHESNKSASVDSQLAYLLNTLSDEIATFGLINNQRIIAELKQSIRDLKPDSIMANLRERGYQVTKLGLSVANIHLILDTDDDGVVNEEDPDDDNDLIADANDQKPYVYNEAPLLTHPNQLSNIPSMESVTFTWSVSKYAVGMAIQISPFRDFSEGVTSYSIKSKSLVTRINIAGTYFVRARSQDAFGTLGDWSSVSEILVGEFSRPIFIGKPDVANNMISTIDGGYVLTSTHVGSTGAVEGKITKLNGAGEFLWDYATDLSTIDLQVMELSDRSIIFFGQQEFSSLSEDGTLKWKKTSYLNVSPKSVNNLIEHNGNLLTIHTNDEFGIPELFSIDQNSGELSPTSIPLPFLMKSSIKFRKVYALVRSRNDRFIVAYESGCTYIGSAPICDVPRVSEFDDKGTEFWQWTDSIFRSTTGMLGEFGARILKNKFVLGAYSSSGTSPIINENGRRVAEIRLIARIGWVPHIETSREGRLQLISQDTGPLTLTLIDTEAASSRQISIECGTTASCTPIAFSATADGGTAILSKAADQTLLTKIADVDKLWK